MPDKINCALYLPNEILAIVINQLASNNAETLAALASCRLASYTLCSLATPLFFSSITLTDYAGPETDHSILVKRVTRLNKILSVYNIAATVHTLTLRCHYKTFRNSISGTHMSAILHRLPHIRNFTLKVDGKRRRLSFPSIPEDLGSAILALCRSPNLTALCLDNVEYFPFTAITACPNLRYLRLWHVDELRVDFFFFVVSATTHPIYSSLTT